MEKIENDKIYKIILALPIAFSFSIIALFCFFFIGLCKVDAALPINFTQSEYLRNVTGNDSADYGTVLNYCVDDWGCNVPTSNIFTQNGMVANFTKKDSSVANSEYMIINGNSYSLSYTIDLFKNENIRTSLRPSIAIYSNSTWYLATCDAGQEYSTNVIYEENDVYGTDYRQTFYYSCDTLNSTKNSNTLRIGIFGLGTNGVFSSTTNWVSDITLIDKDRAGNSTEEIINNDNVNTDKIINNQNNNADKITQNQNENTDKVVDAIEGEGLEDTTEVDTDKKNELEEVEEELLDENITTSLNDIDISIDTNSNEFIWNLVTRIINTNSLIFGLVITMLSLGILKLVLNR